MESLVAQRIKSVLEAKQISISAFSKMIGMQQVTCNRQLRGDQAVSLGLIEGFLNEFDEISAEWLLRGNGKQLLIQNRTKASKVHLLGYFAERLPTSLGGSSQIFYPLHAKLLVYVNHLGRLATELDDMLLHILYSLARFIRPTCLLLGNLHDV